MHREKNPNWKKNQWKLIRSIGLQRRYRARLRRLALNLHAGRGRFVVWSRDTVYIDYGISWSSRVLWLGHSCFVPNLLDFIIHQSSCHYMLDGIQNDGGVEWTTLNSTESDVRKQPFSPYGINTEWHHKYGDAQERPHRHRWNWRCVYHDTVAWCILQHVRVCGRLKNMYQLVTTHIIACSYRRNPKIS